MSKSKGKRSYFQRALHTASTACMNVDYQQTVFEPQGQPNPYYDKVEAMLDMREEIREFAEDRILSLVEKFSTGKSGVNDVDRYALIHELMSNGAFEEWCEFADEFDRIPETTGYMPAPPSKLDFYERVLDGPKLVDVGCGDLDTAKKWLDLEVDRCDPKTTGETFAEYLQGNDPERAVSFNSMTQLDFDEVEQIKELDGLHVFPDVPSLIDMGIVERRDGKLQTVSATGHVWEDKVSDVPPGVRLKTGYIGASTFREREISVEFDDEKKTNVDPSYRTFDTFATPNVNMVQTEDCSPKIDGEMVRIASDGKECIIVWRNKTYHTGKTHSPPFEILAEIFPNEDGSMKRKAVLLRLTGYNGFIPYHGGNILRYFVKRVKMRWRFMNQWTELIAPPEWTGKSKYVVDGFEIPFDGRIVRTQLKDYYHKTIWTFDTEDLPGLSEYLVFRGWELDLVGFPPDEGVAEFEYMVVRNGYVSARYKRMRPDRETGASHALIFESFQRS